MFTCDLELLKKDSVFSLFKTGCLQVIVCDGGAGRRVCNCGDFYGGKTEDAVTADILLWAGEKTFQPACRSLSTILQTEAVWRACSLGLSYAYYACYYSPG